MKYHEATKVFQTLWTLWPKADVDHTSVAQSPYAILHRPRSILSVEATKVLQTTATQVFHRGFCRAELALAAVIGKTYEVPCTSVAVWTLSMM